MLHRIIDETFSGQIQAITELCAIPSVSRGEALPGMPLGKHVHDALHYMLDLANRLGFPNTKSLDGYCGVIDYGEGDEMLMIMAHLDVVPAGPAWSSDPFKPEIRNGRLYARGIIDDKGPAVSALYALYAIKEAGIPLKRRIRIFLGCDEEMDWLCIDRYKKTEPEPDMAFTPDGCYPVVHSEMNICHTAYERKLHGSAVHIDCGTAANVVPGEAEATLAFPAIKADCREGIALTVDGNHIKCVGRGGHAAMPDLSDNALTALIGVLAGQPLSGDDLTVATGLHALLGSDKHGEGFGLDVSDVSGHLTLSADILHWTDESVRLTLDCRHPFCIPAEELLKKLDAPLAALGFERVFLRASTGHFVSPDSELVQVLTDVYERNIGHSAKPLSIGGGTYARAFKNAVAFGAEPECGPEEAHMPDESSGLDEIRFNTVVMAEAIEKLAGIGK